MKNKKNNELDIFTDFLNKNAVEVKQILTIEEIANVLKQLKKELKKDNSLEDDKILQDILVMCIKGNVLLTNNNIEIIKENMKNTYIKKNNDYGNSVFKVADEFYDNYYLTFLIRIFDKLNRLENLVLNQTKSKVDECIEDTFLDCANYILLFFTYKHIVNN